MLLFSALILAVTLLVEISTAQSCNVGKGNCNGKVPFALVLDNGVAQLRLSSSDSSISGSVCAAAFRVNVS